ncbi:hypothetical protein LNQ82_02235 [Conchiformibius steedae DSM 2580]|uniref:Uncharacterized protein n=1 Tax=Conchiformibius steedae DSM 2580 TaxID=1121352 RepID=A0AAE9KYS8_9NEIS|nr:hypothetical protein [Conchiformibius steedae]QMT33357.1 hypothetical protein H3L98_09765 [Conchiformibius steedae]URD68002.1 hypothetical protein LNQ82_02235 [Conchiformibius steedae DSM 2580]
MILKDKVKGGVSKARIISCLRTAGYAVAGARGKVFAFVDSLVGKINKRRLMGLSGVFSWQGEIRV